MDILETSTFTSTDDGSKIKVRLEEKGVILMRRTFYNKKYIAIYFNQLLNVSVSNSANTVANVEQNGFSLLGYR
jgi:hypothetical protein